MKGAFADQVGGVRPDDVQAQDLAGGVVGDDLDKPSVSMPATERPSAAKL